MKILIADDHELFRDGLRLVLSSLDPALEVVEACTYDEALRLVSTNGDGAEAFTLILVDLVMPGLPWSEGLQALRLAAPETPVVVLSASEDRKLVRDAVRLGASGFIPKTSSSRVMISALKLVLSGGMYLPAALLDDEVIVEPVAVQAPAGGAGGPTGPTASRLTPRQGEVLRLLGQGKSNKEIARVLDLSEGTVKLHVTAILKALGVNNRTGAVIAAQRLGLTG
ncbi:LuxR C-terminal-related transcriptional regulator [Rhodospirillum rubrum]|uniref:Two component transcriptional regulator, LuxR family n=1 Tax=Rhodospirillum rubrum (strain ATCC 11170 / ATH 1.1.1 / DSM 467 / LMG 4362 / NCIMB 8255 / S1) TaxID=269796 RepID=Q2RPC1_RHORT|nr:response regulator transcription factor [Rhodospirillum rubrum]ABC24024.1 two component transcriptional regulator, LuxR family [Rhodospirillum rubrum ATCC 11170]AEO49768.1 two component LuxR family transcriptional regulator [Rhodospirillum rubrum F11]MBK5955708.1 DNA-binding response regulator [Rhodospirillum rubrum]QXG79967.1 response regulator transcription factor [Rhodospirillum rubrum]HAQ00042.1 DNA-binding response regulator [Rhodospirillum rubrum]